MNQMNHMDGWTNGWGGGWMWVVGVVVVVVALFFIIGRMGRRTRSRGPKGVR